MSQLLIRDVAEDVVAQIKGRARARGVSMQKELQGLLRLALAWRAPTDDRTVYPPVKPVAVKGRAASRELVEARR